LTDANRADLSAKVRHVAVEEGDGAGYDVLSYEEDGRELYVEVKPRLVVKTVCSF
jgi:hypothetical protein